MNYKIKTAKEFVDFIKRKAAMTTHRKINSPEIEWVFFEPKEYLTGLGHAIGGKLPAERKICAKVLLKYYAGESGELFWGLERSLKIPLNLHHEDGGIYYGTVGPYRSPDSSYVLGGESTLQDFMEPLTSPIGFIMSSCDPRFFISTQDFKDYSTGISQEEYAISPYSNRKLQKEFDSNILSELNRIQNAGSLENAIKMIIKSSR